MEPWSGTDDTSETWLWRDAPQLLCGCLGKGVQSPHLVEFKVLSVASNEFWKQVACE